MTPAALRASAARCRRLAAGVIDRDDPMVVRLLILAEKLEAQAELLEAQTNKPQS